MRRLILPCLICLLWSAPLRAAEVVVYAAASLAGALDRVADTWEDATGHTVTRVYAGSSAIARQVEAGAPAEVVFLANTAWMDHLAARDAVLASSIRQIVSNRLVLISDPLQAPFALSDLPNMIGENDRLALALTEAVPAGIYARAALENEGLRDALWPHVVETDNVRAALQLVALGAARFGIVYATDAVVDFRVRPLAEIPEASHPPIRYPAAITRTASPEAFAFLAYLESGPARAIFTDAGFGAIEP